MFGTGTVNAVAGAGERVAAGSGISLGEGLILFGVFAFGFLAIAATSSAPKMFL